MTRFFRYDSPTAGLWIVAALAVLATACAGNYGYIHADPSVAAAFRGQPDGASYRFYFSGREGVPDAVIGIDTRFALADALWTEVDPNTQRFRDVVSRVFRPDGEAVTAGWIMGPGSRRIGIWYSPYHRTNVRVDPDGTVVVFSPYSPASRFGADRYFP